VFTLLAPSFISNQACDVAYWHIADNPAATAFVRYWTNNGQRLALGRDGSVANDPTATLAVHCGNGFDAGLPRYKRRGDCDLRTVPHHK
jgi:hypothetical protein